MPATDVPADLLHAIAECQGRVVLVVGAGCSLEPPTGLKLASEYAVEVLNELVLDGVLADGGCHDSQDLSLVASTVWARHGSQAAVVERLPRAKFRTARLNDGYLIAAALLRERAVVRVRLRLRGGHVSTVANVKSSSRLRSRLRANCSAASAP